MLTFREFFREMGRIPIFTVKLSTTNDVDKRIQHDDF